MKENLIGEYISKITSEFNTGQAREHAYRPALKFLFESVVPKLHAINDPKHSEHGAPDFALMRSRDLSAGYAEAKDITANLDEEEKSEQMKRYYEYGSLILTNSLEFRFYRHGYKYGEPIIVAKLENGKVVSNDKSYNDLEDTIRTFLIETENISSSSKLAKIMGDKARRIREKVKEYVSHSEERNLELQRMYESFKKILIPDLSEEQFADMYAQTLVYGLFAARFEDKTPVNFSRQEARDLVPHSNPFLRNFFDHIAGASFDIRLTIIVNELCVIFQNADVHDLMHQYTKQKSILDDENEKADPVIHFYEDFLREYDPEQKKKLGAYYTPLPVVRFIIRATDYILEKEFDIVGGLSNATKIDVKVTKQNKTAKSSVHKIQIHDPACGTGTFLNELVKNIFSRFNGQEGRWKSYVEDDLLPRIHGFELMMAPYTIAHLKIAMTLHEEGVVNFRERLGIYLTNSLEEGVKESESLFGIGFGQSITEESIAASRIKNDTPIMVVIGNPPYSVSSSNKGEWIQKLVQIYKTGLTGERNIQPLSDDYIKFIRLSEHFIEENQSGIVAMITNNSFLDGRIHRQMRKHLLETFNGIYILDLHGSSKKGEKTPDGGKDENVFDIQQGVSISIFIRKKGTKKSLGKVYHSELFGKSVDKFRILNKSNLETIKWKELEYSEPHYFFVPKDFSLQKVYDEGFKINELIPVYASGIKTHRDDFVIDFEERTLRERIDLFSDPSRTDTEIRQILKLKDNRDWSLIEARKLIRRENREDNYKNILYRPFDFRWIYYSSSVVDFDRRDVAGNMLLPNLNLIIMKANDSAENFVAMASNLLNEKGSLPSSNYFTFPLYIYSELHSRNANLNNEIVKRIEIITGNVSPENIFDYIYAILNNITYRKRYEEFLKIDFPRVPYPTDNKQFLELATIGRELRELHTLESPKVDKYITSFPISGEDIIEKLTYKNEKVYINKEQYFGNLPESTWNFHFGGYQPAQKWLKDRKGRKLKNEDIKHYQKMIVAIVETERIIKEMDKLILGI